MAPRLVIPSTTPGSHFNQKLGITKFWISLGADNSKTVRYIRGQQFFDMRQGSCRNKRPILYFVHDTEDFLPPFYRHTSITDVKTATKVSKMWDRCIENNNWSLSHSKYVKFLSSYIATVLRFELPPLSVLRFTPTWKENKVKRLWHCASGVFYSPRRRIQHTSDWKRFRWLLEEWNLFMQPSRTEQFAYHNYSPTEYSLKFQRPIQVLSHFSDVEFGGALWCNPQNRDRN